MRLHARVNAAVRSVTRASPAAAHSPLNASLIDGDAAGVGDHVGHHHNAVRGEDVVAFRRGRAVRSFDQHARAGQSLRLDGFARGEAPVKV